MNPLTRTLCTPTLKALAGVGLLLGALLIEEPLATAS